MTSKSDILTQSLIDYINDVKPYHTKFRDVSSQIFFADSFNVNMKDSHTINYNLQNMWGRDDVGGYMLTNMSEGADFTTAVKTGTGTGSLSPITMTIGTVVVETWTLTAISPSEFTVVGSLSGAQANAFVTPLTSPATTPIHYDNGIIGFNIYEGPKAFVTGDTFTFDITGDQHYHIPSTVFPRFTITDSASQSPPGDDPANTDYPYLPVDAGSFVVGVTYTITTIGTDFTLIGAVSNTVGISFIATDVGAGTGTATQRIRTPSHQVGVYDQIPVAAFINSLDQVGLNFEIKIDLTYETLYGFVAPVGYVTSSTDMQIAFNGVVWTGGFTKNGDTISVAYTPTPGPNSVVAVEVLYLTTGRYAVPYHQGSRVTVDGTLLTFGTNYIVEKSRDFIQFLPVHSVPVYDILGNVSYTSVPNSWPSEGQNIEINIFRSDRLFICWQDPFNYKTIQDVFTINATPTILPTAA
jgi:hypothetical protein